MADEKRTPRTATRSDRAADIESLAARLFAATLASRTGRTTDSVAADALASARTFYRVCDEAPGLSAPDKAG